MKNAWLENTNCNLLKINKFKSISNHDITHTVTIDDNSFIKNLIARILTIPADGDMMISFGPNVEVIHLEFHCGNKIQTIEIYGNRFKTPSTGFNSGKNELEENLYRDIDALLIPDFNKMTPKVINLVLPFKDFSITYKGSEYKDYAPKTISFNIDHFLMKDANKNEQLIQISSGQRPPQPEIIKINGKKYTLLTYEAKEHVRLYPHHFQMIK